jgi:hypothetical protein
MLIRLEGSMVKVGEKTPQKIKRVKGHSSPKRLTVVQF